MSEAGGQVIYCAQCGTQTSADLNFCTSCGERLSLPTDANPIEHNAQVDPSDGNPAEPMATSGPSEGTWPTNRRRWIVIGAAAGILVICALVAFMVLRGPSTGEAVPVTPTSSQPSAGPSLTSPSPAASPTEPSTTTLYFRPEGTDAMEFVGVKVTGNEARDYVLYPDTTYCFRGTVSEYGLTGKALVIGNVGSEFQKISWAARGIGTNFQLLTGPDEIKLIPTTPNGLPSFFSALDFEGEFKKCDKDWARGPQKF